MPSGVSFDPELHAWDSPRREDAGNRPDIAKGPGAGTPRPRGRNRSLRQERAYRPIRARVKHPNPVPFAIPAPTGKAGTMRLRTIREARGWTLPDLAVATGLSVGFLSRVERDERSLSTEARVRVARAFRLTPAQAAEVPELGLEAATRIGVVVSPEEVGAMLTEIAERLRDAGGAS